jgi:hypothetical protein
MVLHSLKSEDHLIHEVRAFNVLPDSYFLSASLINEFCLLENLEKVRSNSMKTTFSPHHFENDAIADERFPSFGRRESSPVIVSFQTGKNTTKQRFYSLT